MKKYDFEVGIMNIEAYLTMQAFLEMIYERTAADDIGALLGDIQLDSEGIPFDSAVIADWNSVVMSREKSSQDQ